MYKVGIEMLTSIEKTLDKIVKKKSVTQKDLAELEKISATIKQNYTKIKA